MTTLSLDTPASVRVWSLQWCVVKVSSPSDVWWHAGDERRVSTRQQELASVQRQISGQVRPTSASAELNADSTGKRSSQHVCRQVPVCVCF